MEPRTRQTISAVVVLLCTVACTAAIVAVWAVGQTPRRHTVMRYLPVADDVVAVQRVDLRDGRVLRRSIDVDAASAAIALDFGHPATLSIIKTLRLPAGDDMTLSALLAAPAAQNIIVDHDGDAFTRTETLSLFDDDSAYLVQQSFSDLSVVFVPALPLLRVAAAVGVTEQVTGSVTFLPGGGETTYTATITLRERTNVSSPLGSFDDCLVVLTGLYIGETDFGWSLRTYCAGVGEVASRAIDAAGREIERTTTLLAIAQDRVIVADTLPTAEASPLPLTTEPAAPRWFYSHTQRTASILAAPEIADGRVFVGNYHGETLALDAADGRRLWRFQSGGPIFGAVTHADGRVFFGSADRRVYALHAASGALLWTYAMPDAVIAAPTVHDGVIYVGDESGRVVALAADDGRELAAFAAGGAIAFPPVAAGDEIYVASESGALFALDARTLTRRWAFAAPLPLASPPLVSDEAVYFTAHDETVYAVARHPRSDDGEMLWSTWLRTTSQGALRRSDDLLLATSSDRIFALDARDGSRRWTTERASFNGGAVLAGDCAVVAGEDALAAYSLTDGGRRSTIPTGTRGRLSAVAVTDQHFLVGSSSGDVVASPRTALPCRDQRSDSTP